MTAVYSNVANDKQEERLDSITATLISRMKVAEHSKTFFRHEVCCVHTTSEGDKTAIGLQPVNPPSTKAKKIKKEQQTSKLDIVVILDTIIDNEVVFGNSTTPKNKRMDAQYALAVPEDEENDKLVVLELDELDLYALVEESSYQNQLVETFDRNKDYLLVPEKGGLMPTPLPTNKALNLP